MLMDIYEKFLKNQQLISTITDNASNFVKAFKKYSVSDTEGIHITYTHTI